MKRKLFLALAVLFMIVFTMQSCVVAPPRYGYYRPMHRPHYHPGYYGY